MQNNRERNRTVPMLEQPNKGLMERFGVKAMFHLTQVNRGRLANLAQWVDKNSIKVSVDRTLSIDDAAKALDYVKDVHPRGKVALSMQWWCGTQSKPASGYGLGNSLWRNRLGGNLNNRAIHAKRDNHFLFIFLV